jgi:hypothetical protein
MKNVIQNMSLEDLIQSLKIIQLLLALILGLKYFFGKKQNLFF